MNTSGELPPYFFEPPPGSMTRNDWQDREHDNFPFSWAVRGAIWRVTASIVVPVVWLSLTFLFFAFGSAGFTLVQDIAVAFVSLLGLFGVLTLIWLSFGSKPTVGGPTGRIHKRIQSTRWDHDGRSPGLGF